MIKDFLRRKEIVERSMVIADGIMERYPPKLETATPAQDKAALKKKQRKLTRALQMGKMDIDRNISEMGLGIYGRAKFYQTIKYAMLDKGYSEDSARMITEELAVRFK